MAPSHHDDYTGARLAFSFLLGDVGKRPWSFSYRWHAFSTLLGCRRTQRHAGAEKVFEHAHNFERFTTFEQKRCKSFKDRYTNVIKSLITVSHYSVHLIITYLVLYTVNIATDISRMTQRHTSTVAKHRINDITHVWYRWYDVLPLRPCAHARSSSNNSAYFGGDHALTGNWSWPGTAILL